MVACLTSEIPAGFPGCCYFFLLLLTVPCPETFGSYCLPRLPLATGLSVWVGGPAEQGRMTQHGAPTWGWEVSGGKPQAGNRATHPTQRLALASVLLHFPSAGSSPSPLPLQFYPQSSPRTFCGSLLPTKPCWTLKVLHFLASIYLSSPSHHLLLSLTWSDFQKYWFCHIPCLLKTFLQLPMACRIKSKLLRITWELVSASLPSSIFRGILKAKLSLMPFEHTGLFHDIDYLHILFPWLLNI